MPVLTGSITIADLLDGVTGASVVLENETHTFVASADGEIAAGELSAFSCATDVYAGSTEYTYTSGTPAASQYTIGTVTGNPALSDADITVNISATGTITISDTGNASDGFDDSNTTYDSLTLTVPFSINIAGTTVTYNRTISLTKAKGGDTRLVRMTATRQTMEYAFGAAAPKSTEGNIVFTLTSINYGDDTSNATWSYSVNGAAFSAIDSDTGAISGTNNNTLTITPTQYDHAIDEGSEATYVTYRGTRDQRFDQITVVKLQDAEGGYSIVIEVLGGVSVFRNDPNYSSTDPTTYCDIRARVYRGGLELTSGLSYQWTKNGTNLANSDLDPAQPANYGVTNDRIRVGAQDISDNGSELFACVVNTDA